LEDGFFPSDSLIKAIATCLQTQSEKNDNCRIIASFFTSFILIVIIVCNAKAFERILNHYTGILSVEFGKTPTETEREKMLSHGLGLLSRFLWL